MFQPNLVGVLRNRIGRDVHGMPSYGSERACPFAIVNLELRTQKTSVRADSSGSRGSADEVTSSNLKILVPSYVQIAVDDQFTFEGQRYQISTKHVRRSVMGTIDHIECDLEVLP